jgi:hypothetical protein
MKPDSRKDTISGRKALPRRKDALPKSEVTLESLPSLEGLVVQRLINAKDINADDPESGELDIGDHHEEKEFSANLARSTDTTRLPPCSQGAGRS